MLTHPFALTAAGTVIHIDQAEGDKGPFCCAGCGDAMSLVRESRPHRRRGSDREIQRRPYFRHAHRDDCVTGLETSLHLWAKMIIEEAMDVGLPVHHVEYQEMKRDFDTPWTFDHVTTEEWQDGIRPDVVLHHADGSLNVEVRVSHAVDKRKANILRDRGTSCIEIDLSGYDFDTASGDELREAILRHAPREWIAHQLEDQRVAILEAEWQILLLAKGEKLGRFMESVPDDVPTDRLARYEREIIELGTAPFIGRIVHGAYWFRAPARIWQHLAIKHCLVDGESTYEQGKPYLGEIETYRNMDLRPFPDRQMLDATGLTEESYGSPIRTIQTYFCMLCDEPDIPGAHPIARRLVSHGSTPGMIQTNPDRVLYLEMRKILRGLYLEAGNRLALDADDFSRWYMAPLEANGPTPRRICVDGRTIYATLIAHLHAIINMLNGGWPVERLLGIETADYRNVAAERYNLSVDRGGGPQPEDDISYGVCESFRLMRAGRGIQDILETMAVRRHRTRTEAMAFLQTPNPYFAGTTPMEFAVDIPTMQYCIDIMPVAPDLVVKDGWRHPRQKIRVW